MIGKADKKKKTGEAKAEKKAAPKAAKPSTPEPQQKKSVAPIDDLAARLKAVHAASKDPSPVQVRLLQRVQTTFKDLDLLVSKLEHHAGIK